MVVSDRVATNAERPADEGNTVIDGRLTELAKMCHDVPIGKLSAEALGKPIEKLRPLRPGSKWGLPE